MLEQISAFFEEVSTGTVDDSPVILVNLFQIANVCDIHNRSCA